MVQQGARCTFRGSRADVERRIHTGIKNETAIVQALLRGKAHDEIALLFGEEVLDLLPGGVRPN